MNEPLDYFHDLALGNDATMNTAVQISLWNPDAAKTGLKVRVFLLLASEVLELQACATTILGYVHPLRNIYSSP